jgi:hypothetical protein
MMRGAIKQGRPNKEEARPRAQPSLQVEAIRALGGHGDACARNMAPVNDVGRAGVSKSDGMPHPWCAVAALI